MGQACWARRRGENRATTTRTTKNSPVKKAESRSTSLRCSIPSFCLQLLQCVWFAALVKHLTHLTLQLIPRVNTVEGKQALSALQRAFTDAERLIPGLANEFVSEIVDSVEHVEEDHR